MNSVLKWLIFLFAISTIVFSAKARDVTFCQPNIATDLWEQPSKDVAVAVTLSERIKKQIHKNAIHIYIKNVSTSAWGFFPNNADSGIMIFYYDSNHVQIPLHDYSDKSDKTGGIKINQSFLSEVAINPGKTLRVSIDITPEESAILKLHPVSCKFDIYGIPDMQYYTVVTSPRMLTNEP